MSSNVFRYANVSVKYRKEWRSGTLTLERASSSSPFVVQFEPDQLAYQAVAFTAPASELDFQCGAKDGEHFLRFIDVNGTLGWKKPKSFNFGNREHAVATVVKNLQTPVMNSGMDLDPSQAAHSQPGQPSQSSQSSIPGHDASQSAGSSEYFSKYHPNGVKNDELPDPGGSTPIEREARLSILERDDEVRELFKAVVTGNLMTAEEFWQARSNIVNEEKMELGQVRGLSSGLTADIRANRTSQDGKSFEITQETIHRIFLDQPRVQRLHKAQVGGNLMTEAEFWTLYLSSRYFYQGQDVTPEFRASPQAQAAIKIFGDFDDDDEDDDDDEELRTRSLNDHASRLNALAVDPNVDLLTSLRDEPHGNPTTLAGVGLAAHASFGITDRDPSEAAKDKKNRERVKKLGRKVTMEDVEKLESKPLSANPLMSRYNKHSVLALPEEKGERYARRVKNRLERMTIDDREADILVDLAHADKPVEPPVVPLNLSGKSAYAAVGGKSASGTASTSLPRVKRERGGVENWNPSLLVSALPPGPTALKVLHQITGHNNGGENAHRTTRLEEVKDHEELLRIFRASNEVRRQFWAQFPPTLSNTIPLEEQPDYRRMEQVVSKLVECTQQVNDFKRYALDTSNLVLVNLLKDVKSQLDQSTSSWGKFKQFMAKRKRVK
mmetsp:Transcript_9501/g.16641  ORF Transcript_9501/g.16641 Transcript_9501/m.16641 type:complete len:666 (-) Transcript_9501:185-2182(-)